MKDEDDDNQAVCEVRKMKTMDFFRILFNV